MPLSAKLAKYFLITQFIATIVLSICVALAVKIKEPESAAALIGLLMVQILLSAVWSSMAPMRVWMRVGLAAIAALFFSGCFYRVAWRDGGGHETAISIAGPMLIQWIFLQIPIWVARGYGWRIRFPESRTKTLIDRSEFQFGIKQLMIWTAVVAVSVAVIQTFVDKVDLSSGGGGSGPEMLVLCLYLTIGNSLIAFPIIWGAFVHHNAAIWILISIGVCAAVCIAEYVLFSFQAMNISFVIIINVSQAILAIIAMQTVRLTGLRLEPPGIAQKE